LLLLQAVRDEAHRFAITYHRGLRDAYSMTSILDGVPGIGPRRKRAVLLAFESVGALREATVSEIAGRSGIPITMATGIKERLSAAGRQS
jgi:excinuclease ABC subunit C